MSLLHGSGKLSDLLAVVVRPLGPMVSCYPSGTRVVIQTPVDVGGMPFTGCIGTVNAVDDDGRYTVAIDNARAAENDDPLTVALPLGQWDHSLAQLFEGYSPGSLLVVADGRGGWVDAEVVQHVGNSAYMLRIDDRATHMTLNAANHAPRTLSRTAYTHALDR